ncbi:MAG: DUF2071 domain-containing protein [Pirellulales bacterium]
MQPGIFLTAEWRHLIVLNYAVEPYLLEPYLPPGLELDFWNGTTYISLVGFLFRRTRLCGLAIPFHRNFPEVNLRFYVKRPMPDGERRGVVFLREIAPRRAVAYVARKFYGEKYLALPMRATIEVDERFKDLASRARFEWRLAKQKYAIEAASSALPRYPEPESLDEFIIEHYWAYSAGVCGTGSCIEYEVEHAPWMIRPAEEARFIGEAASLYGGDLGRVLARPPSSAFLANGSAVSVRRGTPLVASRLIVPVEQTLAANAYE